jgi:hypothetical protein
VGCPGSRLPGSNPRRPRRENTFDHLHRTPPNGSKNGDPKRTPRARRNFAKARIGRANLVSTQYTRVCLRVGAAVLAIAGRLGARPRRVPPDGYHWVAGFEGTGLAPRNSWMRFAASGGRIIILIE